MNPEDDMEEGYEWVPADEPIPRGKTTRQYLEGEFLSSFDGRGQCFVYQDRIMWIIEPSLPLPKIIEGLAKKTIKPYYKRWARQVRRRSMFPGNRHPRIAIWYYVDDPLGRMIPANSEE